MRVQVSLGFMPARRAPKENVRTRLANPQELCKTRFIMTTLTHTTWLRLERAAGLACVLRACAQQPAIDQSSRVFGNPEIGMR